MMDVVSSHALLISILVIAGLVVCWMHYQRAALQKARMALWIEATNGGPNIERPAFALDEDETLLYGAPAVEVERFTSAKTEIVRETVSRTRGGASGAVVGGILGGPVGALAGYAMSTKTTTSTSHDVAQKRCEHHVYSKRVMLWVTTKRIITHDGRAAFPISKWHHSIKQTLRVEAATGRSLLGSQPNTDEILTFPDIFRKSFHIRNGFALRKALRLAGHTAVADPAEPSLPLPR